MTPGRLISADPLKATPPIFLDDAKTVAEPALPDTVPVTSPVRSPEKLVFAVMVVPVIAAGEFPPTTPSRVPTKPPVDVVTPVTSKSFCIFTFFVVVTPVTPS